MKYSIHKLTKFDYQQFKHIFLQLSNTKDFSYEKFLKLLNNLDKTDSVYFCIKLEYTNKIIGCVKFFYDYKLGNNKGFIDDIVIDNNYRNKKIGTYLVNYILEHAKKKDCYVVYAITNLKNKEFYTKLNFKMDKIIANYIIID